MACLSDIVVLIISMIMQYMTMMRRMMNLIVKMILKRGPRKQVNATLVIILTVIVMAMIPLGAQGRLSEGTPHHPC